MAKNAQAEIITMGLKDEGGMIDEASGNEVPNGALKEEVRDDQAAMLSPGEFVIPAYAVRYIGVERLVKLLREAKQGMEQLDDIGLTGEPNADDAGLETAMLPSDMQEGEGSAAFAVGGLQQPTGVYGANLNRPTQQQFGQQQFGQQQFAAPTQQQFAQPAAFAPSAVLPSPLSAPQYKPTVPIKTDKKFTYPDLSYTPGPTGGGLGVAEYVGPDGKSIFVTTVGGKPLSTIPPGFKTRAVYDKDKEEEKDKPPPTAMVRKKEDFIDPGTPEAGSEASTPQGPATSSEIQSVLNSLTGGNKGLSKGMIGTAIASKGSSIIPAIIGQVLNNIFGPARAANILDRSGRPPPGSKNSQGRFYDPKAKYSKEDLIAMLEDEKEIMLDVEKFNRTQKEGKQITGGRNTFFGGKGKYGGTTLEGMKFDEGESIFGDLDVKAAIEEAGESGFFDAKGNPVSAEAVEAAGNAARDAAKTAAGEDALFDGYNTSLPSPSSSFDAPSLPSTPGEAASAMSDFSDYGFTLASGGLIEKRKTTAKKKKKKNSKSLVNKRKTPSKKKKKGPRGLASSK